MALAHPLRQRILRLIPTGEQLGGGEIAAELDEPAGRIAYHLRVLVKHDALKVVPKCRPLPPLYRWAPDAGWARKMLGEIDQANREDG
ncbi:MAG TPA: helix-turn-helix domain-containing protein [Solirubrobacterales bacterium]|nr:helix-turn-helix domain-containing protein [Solirubrobacterales bacterium]